MGLTQHDCHSLIGCNISSLHSDAGSAFESVLKLKQLKPEFDAQFFATVPATPSAGATL